MKRMAAVLTIVLLSVSWIACNNGLSDSRRMSEQGKNNRLDRSQRTVLDAARYIDFTVKENNAARYTREDIMFELNNTYVLKGGNSFITVDRIDGTVTLSSDDAWYNGTGGHNMYAKYAFDVQAANADCLYIKMDSRKKAQLIIDNEAMANKAVPDLPVCLPLYGYSRNRIEVSPVMDGFILMPSGTYWARKK